MPAHTPTRTALISTAGGLTVVATLSLFAQWGHVEASASERMPRATFTGVDLSAAFVAAALGTGGLLIAVAVFALFSPRQLGWLGLAGLALAVGLLATLVVQLNSAPADLAYVDRFSTDRRYEYEPLALLAAAFAGGAVLLWAALGVIGLRGQRCPDCAEHVSFAAYECPACGYHLPLPRRLKRCVKCVRPIRREAKVCRYCSERQGAPVA